MKILETIGKWLIGILVTSMVGIFEIAIGSLLCITVIGMIIGVPLIIIGIFTIFLSPVLGAFIQIKHCPYCQGNVFLLFNQRGIKCPTCKKYLIIRGTGNNKTWEVLNPVAL